MASKKAAQAVRQAEPRNPTQRPDRGPAPARRPAAPDPTDVIPGIAPLPDQKGKREVVTVIPTQEGFDGWQLRPEGVPFEIEALLDEDGNPIIPPWTVLEEDYEPPQIDLPATNLAAGRRPLVRGGATGYPNL